MSCGVCYGFWKKKNTSQTAHEYKVFQFSPSMIDHRRMEHALLITSSRFIHGDITPATLRIKSQVNQSSDRQKYHICWCVRAISASDFIHVHGARYDKSHLMMFPHIVSPLTDSVLSSSRSTWQHALVRYRGIRFDERFDLPSSSRIDSVYDAGRKKMINSCRSLIYDGHMWRGNYHH